MQRIIRSDFSIHYFAFFISAITFAVYLTSLSNGFLEWDDTRYVVANLHIRSLTPDFFHWAFFDFHESNWHPLTWISHAVDYAIWGLNPMGHHLTSVILHSINTFVVVIVVMKLLEAWTRKQESSWLDGRGMLIAAGATGMLFGIHPLHVESVSWVAERKDLLCGLFFLLSIGAYTGYVHRASAQGRPAAGFLTRGYLLTLGLFILALLSKPMAVTLPVVLLILDWHPFKRIGSFKDFRPVFIEKIPFFALSLGSSVLTVLAQQSGGAIKSFQTYPLSSRLLVGMKSLIVYLWKMLVPVDLIPYYAYPRDVSFLSVTYLLPIVLIVGITIVCIAVARRQRLWLSVWGYYTVMLLPVLGIVQVGSQAMADRYTYLPSLGPFLLVGIAAGWGASKARTITMKALASAAAIVLCVVMGFLSIQQIIIWKNNFSIWNFVIEKGYANDAIPYNNRGIALSELNQFDRAMADYNRAISLSPGQPRFFFNRGNIFAEIKDFDRAQADYSSAIALDPSYYKAYYHRGLTYMETGKNDKAIIDFTVALQLKPDHIPCYINRGSLYLTIAKIEEAISDFTRACELGSYDGCIALTALGATQ